MGRLDKSLARIRESLFKRVEITDAKEEEVEMKLSDESLEVRKKFLKETKDSPTKELKPTKEENKKQGIVINLDDNPTEEENEDYEIVVNPNTIVEKLPESWTTPDELEELIKQEEESLSKAVEVVMDKSKHERMRALVKKCEKELTNSKDETYHDLLTRFGDANYLEDVANRAYKCGAIPVRYFAELLIYADDAKRSVCKQIGGIA